MILWSLFRKTQPDTVLYFWTSYLRCILRVCSGHSWWPITLQMPDPTLGPSWNSQEAYSLMDSFLARQHLLPLLLKWYPILSDSSALALRTGWFLALIHQACLWQAASSDKWTFCSGWLWCLHHDALQGNICGFQFWVSFTSRPNKASEALWPVKKKDIGGTCKYLGSLILHSLSAFQQC